MYVTTIVAYSGVEIFEVELEEVTSDPEDTFERSRSSFDIGGRTGLDR